MGRDGAALGRGDDVVGGPDHVPGRDRLPGRDPGLVEQRACRQRPLGGGQHRAVAGRQAVGEASGEHALLDVGVGDASGGAGEGHEVEDGGQVCHGEARPGAGELDQVLALRRHIGVDVDQRLHVAVAGGGVGDDRPAVGVADQDDGAADGVQEGGDGGGVVGQAPQRVGRGVDGVAGTLRRPMTPSQLPESAHAPCTSTIVGLGELACGAALAWVVGAVVAWGSRPGPRRR